MSSPSKGNRGSIGTPQEKARATVNWESPDLSQGQQQRVTTHLPGGSPHRLCVRLDMGGLGECLRLDGMCGSAGPSSRAGW